MKLIVEEQFITLGNCVLYKELITIYVGLMDKTPIALLNRLQANEYLLLGAHMKLP